MAVTKQAEENKALVRRVVEKLVDERDFDMLEETHANDFVIHGGVGSDGPVTGREAYESAVRGVLEAFPDLSATIEDIVAEDDLVAYRFTFTGTHEGEFMGVAGSGTRVSWEGMSLARIEDGKFAELRGFPDNLDLMQQLGITELPGA